MRRCLTVLSLVALLGGGCSLYLDTDEAEFPCGESGECPAGFECKDDQCSRCPSGTCGGDQAP